MSVEIVVALISAAVAVMSAVLSTWAARGTARLQHELEERRRRASKGELVEQVMSRYREPLLRAAFDLQSRIYNIFKQDFLQKYLLRGGAAEQEYARKSTLFVLAEYLGWVEVLRRGVQFLDLGDVERNRRLVERLDAIGTVLSTDRQFTDPTFRLFRGQQRAIGECMIDPSATTESGRGLECIGYAAFSAKLDEEPGFARWFTDLERDLEQGAGDPAANSDRLVALQRALMDLIDFLDDPPARFPQDQRSRL